MPTSNLTNINSNDSNISIPINQNKNDENDEERKRREKQKMRRHQYHLPGEDDEELEKTICLGPNTVPERPGKCMCKYGFIGKPETINTTGCWKCDPPCHGSASCVANNTCECKAQLIGDGITHCDPPVPHLISIGKPIKIDGILKEPVRFPVKVDANGFEPHTAFCKFGDLIAGALLSSSTEIICLTPLDAKGNVKLSVSYNGTAFSNSLDYSVVHGKIIPFEPPRPIIPKNEKLNNIEKHNISMTLISFVCLLFSIILYIISRKRPRKQRSSEEALIKKE